MPINWIRSGPGGVTPIVPDLAITTGVASGAKGNHVGVYGSSEANIGQDGEVV